MTEKSNFIGQLRSAWKVSPQVCPLCFANQWISQDIWSLSSQSECLRMDTHWVWYMYIHSLFKMPKITNIYLFKKKKKQQLEKVNLEVNPNFIYSIYSIYWNVCCNFSIKSVKFIQNELTSHKAWYNLYITQVPSGNKSHQPHVTLWVRDHKPWA